MVCQGFVSNKVAYVAYDVVKWRYIWSENETAETSINTSRIHCIKCVLDLELFSWTFSLHLLFFALFSSEKLRKKGYYKRTFGCICFVSNVGCGSHFFHFAFSTCFLLMKVKQNFLLQIFAGSSWKRFFSVVVFGEVAKFNLLLWRNWINILKFTACNCEGKLVIVVLKSVWPLYVDMLWVAN